MAFVISPSVNSRQILKLNSEHLLPDSGVFLLLDAVFWSIKHSTLAFFTGEFSAYKGYEKPKSFSGEVPMFGGY